jgi:hypothetical protein
MIIIVLLNSGYFYRPSLLAKYIIDIIYALSSPIEAIGLGTVE